MLLKSYEHVSRLNLQEVTLNEELEMPITIEWPDGIDTTNDGQLVITEYQNDDPGSGVWYQGIIEMDPLEEREETLENKKERKGIWEIIVNGLGEIFDFLLGLITMAVRMPLIGLANVAEYILTWILQIFSGTAVLDVVDIEDIFFNRVPLLDANIFRAIETAQNEGINAEITGSNVIYILHESILIWYYAFRNLAIIGMLISLIFLGIKMATSSIAEQKAKYKNMLIDWLVSFIIIFVIHYFIVIVLNANTFLLNIFENQVNNVIAINEDSIINTQGGLFEKVREMAYSIKLLEGWLGTFAYIILIWYTIKFSLKYLRRVFNIFILILLAPFIAISYAIDKIKDGKSQSLKKWMKELGFVVLLQSVHALIYTIFVSIVLIQINDVNFGNFAFLMVLLFVTFNFTDKAEELFKNIFNIKGDSVADTEKPIEDTTKSVMAKVTTASTLVKGYKAFGKGAVKVIGNMFNHPLKPYINNAKYGDALPDKKGKKSGGTQNDAKYDAQIQKEKEKTAKMEEELKAQRKEAMKSVKDTIGAFVGAIPTIAENPAVGITLLISGITGVKRSAKTISKYRTTAKMNAKPEMYSKVKALNERKNLEIQLHDQIETLFNNPESIIGRQFAEGATDEQIKTAQKAHKILTDKIRQKSQTLDGTIVSDAINQAILENKGKVDITTIERMKKLIEEGYAKKGKNVKVDTDSIIEARTSTS